MSSKTHDATTPEEMSKGMRVGTLKVEFMRIEITDYYDGVGQSIGEAVDAAIQKRRHEPHEWIKKVCFEFRSDED
jgi:hypothetical protein